MIKAKEARVISVSVELDEQVLDKINNIIITEASKGNYAAGISSILPTTNVAKYYDYLKELGFNICTLYKGEHGIYVTWR